jgi:hypothetical protein
MPCSKTMAFDLSDFGEIRDSSGLPNSPWLRTALEETARREPLPATEDAIMLVDIVIALARGAMTIEEVLSFPLIGDWLKKAAADNLGRPLADVLRDTVLLRDLLLVGLSRRYRSGQLCGPDVDIRVCNITGGLWGIGKAVAFQWSKNAAAHVKRLSQAADGGFSQILGYAELESARGHHEMAEIYQQMSCLSEEELRDQLSRISDSLAALKTQLH